MKMKNASPFLTNGDKKPMPHSELVKYTVDTVSITVLAGTLLDILPAIAAIFTTIWSIIRIYESETFHKFLRRRRKK